MVVIDKMGNVIVANVGDKVPNGSIILEKGNFQLNPGEQGISAKFVESEENTLDITNDVEDIIAGIEQGIDPTALGEEFATAAGGTASSSLTNSATLNLSDEETIAQTSFDTSATFTSYYSETQSLALVDYLNNAILATSIPAASATIILDDITDDNLINSDESGSTVTVTGSVSGDVQSGDTVTLTFEDESGNQTTITGEVSSDATGNLVFSIDVPGSVLASDRDTMIVASVSGMTSSGLSYADSTTKAYTTDLSADTDTTISITRTSNSDGDSVINQNEMTDVSFTVDGVDSDAETVLVTFSDGDAATDDITIEATYDVDSGTWVIDGVNLSDLTSGEITTTVTVTDVNDNQSKVDVILDLDKSADEDGASFTVQVVSDDEVVNAEEVSDVTVKLSGVDDDAVSVVVTFSDGSNSISVNASQDSNGNWVVADVDLSSLEDGNITVSAVVTDDAGNTATASDSLVKDTVAIGAGEGASGEDVGPTVTIVDDLNQDGYINGTEDSDGQISAEIVIDADELAQGGSVSVVIESGDDTTEIELSLDDNGDLVDGDGNSYDYDDTTGTITLPIDVAEGDEVTVTATQTDAAGNESVSGSDNATLDTTAIGASQGSNGENVGPTVTIVDDLNQDGYINGDEDDDSQISAEIVIDADELANGGSVTVVIENGDNTTEIELSLDDNGDLVDGDGNSYDYDDTTGTITLPIEVAEGDEVTVTATQTDAAGNESVSGEVSALLDTSYSAQNESIVTDEDAPVVIDVLANEDTGTSIVSDSVALDDVTKGTVELNEDGTLSFTPAENYNGDVTITYTVEDQYGNTDVATVTITVTGTNDAPTAAATATADATEDGAVITGDVNASDVDATDTLSYSVVDADGNAASAPAGFTLNTDGTWSFDPSNAAYQSLAVDETTDVVVNVLVDDGNGDTTTQEITITVTGTNDAPVVDTNAKIEIAEDADPITLNLLANATDVDGDDLNVTSINGTELSGGEQTITIYDEYGVFAGNVIIDSNNNMTFDSADNYSGKVTLDYIVSDGISTTSSEINIDITPVADAPTLSIDTSHLITINNVTDTTSGYTITAYNADGTEGVISIHTGPDGFGVMADETINGNSFVNGDGSLGVESELGSGEALAVTFDSLHSAVDVSVAYLNASESYQCTFYRDGNLVGTYTHKGGSDWIDDAVSIYPEDAAVGALFDEIVFTGPNLTDDFLIHSISYDKEEILIDEGSSFKLSLSADLTDTDGSETLAVTVSGAPVDAVISDGVHDPVAVTSDNVNAVDISGLDLSNLTVIPPENYSGVFTLIFKATASEVVNDIVVDSASTTTTLSVEVYESIPTAYDSVPDVATLDSVSAIFAVNETEFVREDISPTTVNSSNVIKWGYNDGNDIDYSSLTLNSSGCSSNVDLSNGANITLASITHHNGATYTDESALDYVTVQVSLVIDGVTTTADIVLKQYDTNNSDQRTEDSITLMTESVEVEINGQSYLVVIDGLKSSDGTISNQVWTTENSDATYEIVAHVDAIQTLVGDISYDPGADGLAYLDWYVGTDVNSTATKQTNDVVILVGSYGTLTVNPDGSYSYEMSDSAKSTLTDGQEVSDIFTYQVVDTDGDIDTATVTIDLTGSDSFISASTTSLNGEFYIANKKEVNNISSAIHHIDTNQAEATFDATRIDYDSGTYNTGLGDNLADNHLEAFLNAGGNSDGSSVVGFTDSAITDETVGIIDLNGGVNLSAGAYTLKVNNDDGYQIVIDGVVVASKDGGVSYDESYDYFNFVVDSSGVHQIEIVYYDLGGRYELDVQVKADSDTGYTTLGDGEYWFTNSSWTTVSSEAHTTILNFMEDGASNPEYFDNVYHAVKHGDSGNDVLDGNGGNDWIYGEGGNDILVGGDGSDHLLGGYNDDLLIGDGYNFNGTEYIAEGTSGTSISADYLYGDSGDDILIGGVGADILEGGSGNDVIFGGSYDIVNDKLVSDNYADSLTGGEGKDLFILDGGTGDSADIITDFDSDSDAIDISLILDDVVGSMEYADVQSYLDSHVKISSDVTHLQVDGVTVADFGSDTHLTSGVDVSIIINDLEYTIKA